MPLSVLSYYWEWSSVNIDKIRHTLPQGSKQILCKIKFKMVIHVENTKYDERETIYNSDNLKFYCLSRKDTFDS